MVGGVETSRDGGATQESDKVEFEEFIVTFSGGGTCSIPRQRNMSTTNTIHVSYTYMYMYHIPTCTCTCTSQFCISIKLFHCTL